MRSLAHTTEEYFEQLAPERQTPLLRLRMLIMGIWPTIVEDMDREMPTYHLNGHTLFALANHKEYMTLYIFPHDLLDAFKKDLLIHRHGRSCLRFRHLEEKTIDLFDRVIKHIGNQVHESRITTTRSHRQPTRVGG